MTRHRTTEGDMAALERFNKRHPAPTLTIDDLEAGYDHDNWGGFGYLGTRQDGMGKAKNRAIIRALDDRLLAYANEHGWTADDLFTFTDSKRGRWLAESFLYGPESTRERDFETLLRDHLRDRA